MNPVKRMVVDGQDPPSQHGLDEVMKSGSRGLLPHLTDERRTYPRARGAKP